MSNFERIAKFGGTSVACPQNVRAHVLHEQPEIVVVSAPGVNPATGENRKVTDSLFDIEAGIEVPAAVQRRFGQLAVDMSHDNSAMDAGEAVIASIPDDIAAYQENNWPVAILGEHWASQMYAPYLGYEWVDAAELIRVDEEAQLDLAASIAAIQARLTPHSRYVTGGFCGADKNGDRHMLGRGSGDVTPAVISLALNIPRCEIWSDVPGFMAADPRIHGPSDPFQRLSFRQVITMAEQDGCQLLHPAVCRLLGGTSLQVIMRNTFGLLGNEGTIVACDQYAAA